MLAEQLHDPPPAGAGAIFEMAVDRRIWPAGEALLDLVHGLILGILVVNRKLGPLLEIGDDGHRHPGSARPVRIGRRARVPEQIASSGPGLADLRHSIVLNRRPMDYRLPVAENDTDGAPVTAASHDIASAG